ncbi:MAG TPA: hypothetical protein VKU90_10500 [Caulobacteraceae bacterium]|nr:hypothetical protein [Caulobacteraceae bacterium]
MSFEWRDLAASLREQENSAVFRRLVGAVGEQPQISQTPEEYNDPEGRTRFYKFVNSGIEMGFRDRGLNHIHLFLRPTEGYESYRGPLDRGINKDADESSVRELFGEPSSTGGGKPSALLGFRRRWVKFDLAGYAVRYEFEPEDGLNKVTIIAE